MNLAVITACIPGLKRFLSELQGGLTQLDIRSHIKQSYRLSNIGNGWSTLESHLNKGPAGRPRSSATVPFNTRWGAIEERTAAR